METFTFGREIDGLKQRRNFLKQQMFPMDQFVLKKRLVKKEKVFTQSANIFVLQILQIISRNSENFLMFLFEYFHWLNLTFEGQSDFISHEFLVELFYAFFYFNLIPVTREYVDLNMKSLLNLGSQESRDIYEYYKFIGPIKSEKRGPNRRKKLLQWIKFKETLEEKDNNNPSKWNAI